MCYIEVPFNAGLTSFVYGDSGVSMHHLTAEMEKNITLLKVFGSNKTKGPKHDSQNRLRSADVK